VIDWTLARRIAGVVAGDPGRGRPRPRLAEVATESERIVSAYTGLRPPAPLPAPELLSREQWIAVNHVSMAELLDPVVARIGDGLGPAGTALRTGAGMLVAAELGVLTGYMSQRVLGQYELVILDPESPSRLLFVGPNLDQAATQLGADDDQLLRWVALHEVTHALQFAGVPWLRPHLAALLRELLSSLEVSVDTARLLRLPSAEDIRSLIETVRGGDLLSLVTTPSQRATLDRVQATMAVLEGHAEHVMDAAGPDFVGSIDRLRAAMERRRASASAPARLLGRLLGLDMKMRQYRDGKRFCDTVVEAGGVAALNRVWAAPDALPSLSELSDPLRWMARTPVPTVTKS